MSEARGGAPKLPRTAGETVRMAREFLERKQVEAARLEAELLVAHALGLDRLKLFLQLDRPVTGAEVDRARDLLVRRGRREPAAYILGAREFYGRPFRVGPGVLIPRPETETLVDRAREIAREREGPIRIIDVGTGSGCIAVSLALEIPSARVVAIDVSAAAVLCARANADALGAVLEIVEGEGLETLERTAASEGPFDLVVSNPPYVTAAERPSLAPEVAQHEPAIALFAPDGDPDFWVRSLLDRARSTLALRGRMLVELGHRQASRAIALAKERGLRARTWKDLAGIDRVLEVEGS